MSDFTDEALDHFLQKQVDLRHRLVSKSVEEIQKIVKDLTDEISSKDARFQSIANSGVNNDNIKDQPELLSKWVALLRGRTTVSPAIQVLTPSLYVISVPVRGLLGYREQRARQWRYYTLGGMRLHSPVREPDKLLQWLELESFANPGQEWHDPRLAIEGDIVPAKVVGIFKEQLEAAIQTCQLSSKVSVLESVATVVRVSIETSEQQVEVELVPTVELINCWPKKARWPRLLKRWPSTERVRCIKSFGFNLMATSTYHWLLSFSRAEQVLLGSLDEDGGCRKKCYRVVRQLKEDVWLPGNKPVITAYHLQTLLLWACERFPYGRDWAELGRGVLRLAQRLHKCATQRYLRHYFIPSHNLLKYTSTNELDGMAKKIADFLANPGTY